MGSFPETFNDPFSPVTETGFSTGLLHNSRLLASVTFIVLLILDAKRYAGALP